MSQPNTPSRPTMAAEADPELVERTRVRTMRPTMPAPVPSQGVTREVDARRNRDPRSE